MDNYLEIQEFYILLGLLVLFVTIYWLYDYLQTLYISTSKFLVFKWAYTFVKSICNNVLCFHKILCFPVGAYTLIRSMCDNFV